MKTARMLAILVFALGLTVGVVNAATTNQAPIADAGSSRYAAQDTVVLDGTGSYDPDNSGTLSYTWRQIAGPSVLIIDANTVTPTIGGSMQPGVGRDPTPTLGGFIQTDEIQECEFELLVSDGELISIPDTVKVIIVPDFGPNSFQQENPPFDADKPTIIYFGGGDCTNGLAVDGWSPFTPDWLSRANIIYFPDGYRPDSGGGERTYYKYGDMIIVYLSAVAPDYKQPIQTIGWSTGGQPAVDVGIHLNLIYADARYAINRVTFFDALRYCRGHYSESISTFLGSSVDGEQCWADAYVSATSGGGGFVAGPPFQENVLNVGFPNATGSWYQCHILASGWYANSLVLDEMNEFNHGVVAGAYWSVIGTGKNLQLASTPDEQTYRFNWYGNASSGHMDFYDESNNPGKLPEPIMLVGPPDGSTVGADGAVLSCELSENSIGYQLLFGCDPYHMVYLFSDTPTPPNEQITIFPFEQTFWTVRAYDQYGSTIYADPIHIYAETVSAQTIKNETTGQRYASIQQAINDALDGQEIVISPGICEYLENINFKSKNLTVRSTDPNDPNVVAATVIKGVGQQPAVTLSHTQGAVCVLDGLTITGETVAISCSDAPLMIRNCIIDSTGTNSIEFLNGYEPKIIDCIILGSVSGSYDPRLVALWKMDEEEGNVAYNSIDDNHGILSDNPTWQPNSGQVDGALKFNGIDNYISTDFILDPSDGPFSTFAWVQGGMPGQTILSQVNGRNWLSIDEGIGVLTTELTVGLIIKPLVSETVITDGDWHRVGVSWDGANLVLCVDDVEVARKTQSSMPSSQNGLYIGAGSKLGVDTFFSGLIDDVSIYDVALSAEQIASLAQ